MTVNQLVALALPRLLPQDVTAMRHWLAAGETREEEGTAWRISDREAVEEIERSYGKLPGAAPTGLRGFLEDTGRAPDLLKVLK